MNNNILNHLQPATKQPMKYKYYPTLENITNNPYGISDESVELIKKKPFFQRVVSCFVRSNVDGSDANGNLIRLGALLNARSPQVETLRIDPSFIEKKRIEEGLPIFTPFCTLQYDFTKRTYYPITYTCLLDFDIRQESNRGISLTDLKHELSEFPQIYYCGLATNGTDIFCIVPIAYPQRYLDQAAALVRLFREQGIIISISDEIAHTRTISTDKDGYFNENAKEFTKL